MKLDFDIIKKSFTKAAIKTKETSENMVEIAKLKYKIAEIKSDIDDNYKKIGKLVYNADENADISEEIAAVCTEISALSEKMDDMQRIVAEVKKSISGK